MLKQGDKPQDRAMHTFEVSQKHYAYSTHDRACYALDKADLVDLEIRDAANLFLSLSAATEGPSAQDGGQRAAETPASGATTAEPEGTTRTPNATRGAPVVLRAADFHVTNACNMACKYCYGRDSDGYVRGGEVMMPSTARRAIRFLCASAPAGETFTLVFFGGEPLLNFPLIEEVVEYADDLFAKAGKSIAYTMTTNGTIMRDEILRFIESHRISLMISLDGPRDIQDELRPMRNGTQSSYDVVVANAKKLIMQQRGGVSARATVGSANCDLVAIARHHHALGFRDVRFGVETITGTRSGGGDCAKMQCSYERLFESIVSQFAQGYRYMQEPFASLIRLIAFGQGRRFPCGAGRTYIAIGPQGDLYPCHRFMGMGEHRMGSVRTGLLASRVAQYRALYVHGRKECGECWARELCGGGCPFEFASVNNDIARPSAEFCGLVKRIAELSIALAFELQDQYGEWYDAWIARQQEIAAASRCLMRARDPGAQ